MCCILNSSHYHVVPVHTNSQKLYTTTLFHKISLRHIKHFELHLLVMLCRSRQVQTASLSHRHRKVITSLWQLKPVFVTGWNMWSCFSFHFMLNFNALMPHKQPNTWYRVTLIDFLQNLHKHSRPLTECVYVTCSQSLFCRNQDFLIDMLVCCFWLLGQGANCLPSQRRENASLEPITSETVRFKGVTTCNYKQSEVQTDDGLKTYMTEWNFTSFYFGIKSPANKLQETEIVEQNRAP